MLVLAILSLCGRCAASTDADKAEWVNIGSTTGCFGFDWESAGVRGLNLAAAPQSTRGGFARLKAHRKEIADGAAVIIPVLMFSSVVAADYDKTHVAREKPGELSFDGVPGENALIGFRDLLIGIWKRDYGIRDFADPMNERCRENYRGNVAVMKDLISWCRSEGLRPYFVITPLARSFDGIFPQSFLREYVYDFLRDVSGTGVPLLDCLTSPDFRDDALFCNALSLNRSGRRKFTAEVISRVRRNERGN